MLPFGKVALTNFQLVSAPVLRSESQPTRLVLEMRLHLHANLPPKLT